MSTHRRVLIFRIHFPSLRIFENITPHVVEIVAVPYDVFEIPALPQTAAVHLRLAVNNSRRDRLECADDGEERARSIVRTG